jgi:hypothetical protein
MGMTMHRTGLGLTKILRTVSAISLLCVVIFPACQAQAYDGILTRDNIHEPRPPPDRFVSSKPASWEDLKALRPLNAGKCWVNIPNCVLNPSYSGIGDEFDEAYAELGVGESEQACLARAEYHWEFCGRNPFHQVHMTFLPSGATAAFPDDATVERNYSSKHPFYRLAKWAGTDKASSPHHHLLDIG